MGGKVGPERLAALAEWVQSLYPPDVEPPVLVGGGAVELLTAGTYTTGDLDFVGPVPSGVAKRLREAGFRRRGRHWIHEAQEIFLEFPAGALEEGESFRDLRVRGSTVRIIGLEELIVDRLAAWQFWESTVDGYNAWLLLVRRRDEVDSVRLEMLAGRRQVGAARTELLRFVAAHGDRDPSLGEIERWAARIPH